MVAHDESIVGNYLDALDNTLAEVEELVASARLKSAAGVTTAMGGFARLT